MCAKHMINMTFRWTGFSLWNFRKEFLFCQGKDTLHTFGKRCVGCFCIEPSCITIVFPFWWESVLQCHVSQFPSKSFWCYVLSVFCSENFFNQNW